MFSFNDYKKQLAQLSDDELLALSDLMDDMCHAMLKASQAGGTEGAKKLYEAMIDRNMSEIRDFIARRHARIEKRLT